MDHRRLWAMGAAALGSALLVLAAYATRPDEAEAQVCNRSCGRGPRDARGCCIEGRRGGGGGPRGSGSNASATLECPDGTVSIPAGSFWMGSQDGDENEQPVRRVTLRAFCIDRTEVTVAQYQECVSAGACPPAATTVRHPAYSEQDRTFWSEFCNASRSDRATHPINCVDYENANAYCAWRGGRLPTEAEWEYAARGTDGRTYPWGNEAPDPTRLNACDADCGALDWMPGWRSGRLMFEGHDGFGSTAPVGSYPAGASPFGVLDMAGNVSEWTSAEAGPLPSYRGAAWHYASPIDARAARRREYNPAFRESNVGFRCARGAS